MRRFSTNFPFVKNPHESFLNPEIEEKKIIFDELLAAAKELGFEVFERGENRFHVYRALEMSYAEIVNDLKVQQVEMERSSASSSLPPA